MINAFLKDRNFRIRGITRHPQSDSAQALATKGVDVVYGDLNNEQSLIEAFAGAYAIFGVTDFFEPFAKHGAKKAVEIEYEQATNLARAASKTAGLEHYLWSTLPNSRELSSGKIVVPHMESKNRADAFIKKDKSLLEKTTFLWFGFYSVNLHYPIFMPIHIVSLLPIDDRQSIHGRFILICKIRKALRNTSNSPLQIRRHRSPQEAIIVLMLEFSPMQSLETLPKWEGHLSDASLRITLHSRTILPHGAGEVDLPPTLHPLWW